jgi:hypothetical protein
MLPTMFITLILVLQLCDGFKQNFHRQNMLTLSSTSTRITDNASKIVSSTYAWELDSVAMLEKSTFFIRPDSLLKRCKEVVNMQIGINCADDLAEDFQFIFPVVGPLSKEEYLKAVGKNREFDYLSFI